MDTQKANKICRETELLAFVQVLRAFRMDQSRFLSKMTLLPVLARLLRIDEGYSVRAMAAVQDDKETVDVARAFRESFRRRQDADATPVSLLHPLHAMHAPHGPHGPASSEGAGGPGRSDRPDRADRADRGDKGDKGERGSEGGAEKGSRADKGSKGSKAEDPAKALPKLPEDVPGWSRLDAAVMSRIAREVGFKESAAFRFIRIAFSKRPAQRGKRADLMSGKLRELRRDLLKECARMINQFKQ